MQTRHNTLISSLALAGMLTLLVGQGFAQDASVRVAQRILPGTWDVILRFPAESCTAPCTCPGNTPNLPIPTVNTFLRDGAMLFAGATFLVGPGHGHWERLGRNRFVVRYKHAYLRPDGSLRGSVIATKTLRFTDPDTFEGTVTADLFDAAGNMTAQGCPVNETATRFE